MIMGDSLARDHSITVGIMANKTQTNIVNVSNYDDFSFLQTQHKVHSCLLTCELYKVGGTMVSVMYIFFSWTIFVG